MAELLCKSALLVQDARALAVAYALCETYQPENIYHSKDLVNFETGEEFAGYGTLVNLTSSRLCKAYLSTQARRSRKKIRASFAKIQRRYGERDRFITFSLPFLRCSYATVCKIVDRAMSLLKKRKLWKDAVRAGWISEELTIGASSTLYFTHFHKHLHALVVARWLNQWELANEWTDCVEKACAEFEVEFLMTNLISNRLSVEIRDVATYARKNSMSMEDAIEECVKYVVKGSEFDKVPLHQIVEIEAALHKRKMVRPYGEFDQHKGRTKKTEVSTESSLDTKDTTDGEGVKDSKTPSLLDIGEELIKAGRLDEYILELKRIAADRRQFRRNQLSEIYAYSTFKTLDGNQFFGEEIRQQRKMKPKPEPFPQHFFDYPGVWH